MVVMEIFDVEVRWGETNEERLQKEQDAKMSRPVSFVSVMRGSLVRKKYRCMQNEYFRVITPFHLALLGLLMRLPSHHIISR
ncbi:unnamed protein product [Urochloa humidicola]